MKNAIALRPMVANNQKDREDIISNIKSSKSFTGKEITMVEKLIQDNSTFDRLVIVDKSVLRDSQNISEDHFIMKYNFKFEIKNETLETSINGIRYNLNYDILAYRKNDKFIMIFEGNDIFCIQRIRSLKPQLIGSKSELSCYWTGSYIAPNPAENHDQLIEIMMESAFHLIEGILEGKIYVTVIEDNWEQKNRIRNGNSKTKPTYYLNIDGFFLQDVHVDREIPVRGFYRRQRYGKGRTKTKMVYIDDFVKSGYHRLATKRRLKTIRKSTN